MARPSAAGAIRPVAIVYPLGLWVVMATVAVANGVFRETVLVPWMGDYSGHLLSTALLIAAILLLSYTYFSRTRIDYRRKELLVVGCVWVVLTVGFEFLVGYLESTPVEATLAQYDILAGQVWILVPLTLFVAPLTFGSFLSE